MKQFYKISSYFMFILLIIVVVLELLQIVQSSRSIHTEATPKSDATVKLIGKVIIGENPSQELPSTSREPVFNRIANNRRELHFFHDKLIMKEVKKLTSPWIAKLQDLLGKVHLHKQVSVVFSNIEYLGSLLNWLITAKVKAKPSLKNVIIVCLDRAVFKILNRRSIPSVLIYPNKVIRHVTAIKEKNAIWIVRCTIYRLINYFGYDVISYDTDAIILKDPNVLFNQHNDSDIIGSAGTFPLNLGNRWGFTLCMGVVMFRSTPRTENLWESSSFTIMDDQTLLNNALMKCMIKWSGKNIATTPIDGQCQNGLKVTVLPLSQICRNCTDKNSYVWHQLSEKKNSKKLSTAKKDDLWFLRKDWKLYSHNSKSLKGNEWLASISTL